MKKQLLFLLPFVVLLSSCGRILRSTEREIDYATLKQAADKLSEKRTHVTITGKIEDTKANSSVTLIDINETFTWKDEVWVCDNATSESAFAGIYALNLKYTVDSFDDPEVYTCYKGMSSYRVDFMLPDTLASGGHYRYNKKGNPMDMQFYDSETYQKLTLEFKFK